MKPASVPWKRFMRNYRGTHGIRQLVNKFKNFPGLGTEIVKKFHKKQSRPGAISRESVNGYLL